MTQNHEPAGSSDVVPENLRAAALCALWEHVDRPVQQALLSQFEAESLLIPGYWNTLVGKGNGADWDGVAWAQLHVGRAASLYGPVVRAGDRSLAKQLVSAAVSQARRSGVRIVQALRDLESTPQTQALLDAGFEHSTDLFYMFCDAASVSPFPPETTLCFEPWSVAEEARLKGLIQRTYVDSLDCPTVDGVRTVDEVLAGHRASGVFDPSRWLIVFRTDSGSRKKIDIGCLLLADHPTTEQFELVYMGVVPEERGKGWGCEIVRQALWQTHAAERKRLVLAVDAANKPGVRMYASAGFHTFELKALYLHVLEQSHCS
jgi:mycothiol synthase